MRGAFTYWPWTNGDGTVTHAAGRGSLAVLSPERRCAIVDASVGGDFIRIGNPSLRIRIK